LRCPRTDGVETSSNMGQFSMEKPKLPGSALSGNQHTSATRRRRSGGIGRSAPDIGEWFWII
ncbi:hypothetical protein, partial [Aurantimonas sp. Leaf443]|uniref:hypothetical protein n=1 Tax=Aurantimonas sp. Leaf443 TaxID=1736378 RepID=UPI001AEC4A38